MKGFNFLLAQFTNAHATVILYIRTSEYFLLIVVYMTLTLKTTTLLSEFNIEFPRSHEIFTQ